MFKTLPHEFSASVAIEVVSGLKTLKEIAADQAIQHTKVSQLKM